MNNMTMRLRWSRILARLNGRSLGGVAFVGALFVMPPIAGPPPCAANHPGAPHASAHVAQVGDTHPMDSFPAPMPCCGTFAQLTSAAVESSCAGGGCVPAAPAESATSFPTTFASVLTQGRPIRIAWGSYYARSRRILR